MELGVIFCLPPNGSCMCSAGLKVINFQIRTEPIRLFNIPNFPSNRQRRIGGVATTGRSTKNHRNPHYIWHFVSGSVFVFYHFHRGLIVFFISLKACLEYPLKLLFLLLSQNFRAIWKLPRMNSSCWLLSWSGLCPKPHFIFLLRWEKRSKKNQVKINLSVFS